MLLCRPFCTRFRLACTRAGARSSSRRLSMVANNLNVFNSVSKQIFTWVTVVLERQTTKKMKMSGEEKKASWPMCEHTTGSEKKLRQPTAHISICTHNFPKRAKNGKRRGEQHTNFPIRICRSMVCFSAAHWEINELFTSSSPSSVAARNVRGWARECGR